MGLQAAVYFYASKAFGLRARDEHRRFTLDQVHFGEDSVGPFVRFLGKTAKNNAGGLKHKSVALKDVKHYDSSSSTATYKLTWKYVNSLKDCDIVEGPFYRRPLMSIGGKLRFSKVPLGMNSISQIIPKAAEKARLTGNFTGHSAKATCATSLYQSNVDEQLIMERTGHRSQAVRAYKRTSADQQKRISSLLDYSNQSTESDNPTTSRRAQLFSSFGSEDRVVNFNLQANFF